MKKRERNLAVALALVGGAAMAYQFGPGALRSFDYSKEIDRVRKDYDECEKNKDRFSADVDRYRGYVERTGSTDAERVKTELYASVNELVRQSGLARLRITPKSPEGRKNELQSVKYSLNADGTWTQALEFLRRFYKLPHVAHLGSLTLSPMGGQQNRGDQVKVDADIEVLVLPAAKAVPVKLEGAPAERPSKSAVVDLFPISPFLVPRAEAPLPPRPTVERPTEVVEAGPMWTPDPDRERKYIPMAWVSTRSEVLVAQRGQARGEAVSTGGSLDGGIVVLVHPLGAVVRRPDGAEYIYALGESLSEAVELDKAVAYPEIVAALRRMREQPEEPVPAVDLSTNGMVDTNGVPDEADLDSNGAAEAARRLP